jgi:hypothetical protein
MAEPANGSTPDSVDTLAAPLIPESDGHPHSPVLTIPPVYLNDALGDAERLLHYAAESGIAVDEATRDHVLEARSAAAGNGWTEQTAANLIAALTTLAALVKPVTAASLRACCDDTVPTVRSYLKVAIWLAIFIVPFSVASFLASAISTTIRNDIATANDFAVKLQTQLGYPQENPGPEAPIAPCVPFPPAAPAPIPSGVNANDVITELQQYATTIRSIDARARQLKMLVPNSDPDPCHAIRKDPAKLHQVFQLPAGLPNLARAAQDRTTLYQDIRYFAQNLLDEESFFYGAMTTCILPVLYALLGTCAYLLRTFEQQITNRTFVPSEVNSARFLIAAIGGAVVGLFNNFTINAGASIPPLALAFLVGYAVDVFFAFLEGMLQMFTRTAGSPQPAPQAKPSSE